MRERFYLLPLFVLIHTGSTAQNIRNPYADHSDQTFVLVNELDGTTVDSYVGEYQIFLDDLFWRQLADGGVPSDRTLLLQLAAEVRAGGVVDEGDVALLQGMVQAEPLGAMQPKAILSRVRQQGYSRVPWMVNDTRPGIRSVEQTAAQPRSDGIALWPNPAKDELTIESTGALITELAVVAMDGRVVQAPLTIEGSRAILRVAPLAPGTYAVRVRTADGLVVRRVVIGQ